jgi:GT2 family glycosyltransferase
MRQGFPARKWETSRGRTLILVNSALIIPTRNRSEEIKKTLLHLAFFEALPRTIVVADSSTDSLTRRTVETLRRKFLSIDFRYVHTDYGSPHQKNVALGLLNRSEDSGYEFVAFLDDDIEPDVGYFSTVSRLLKTNSDCVCLGGFDRDLAQPNFMTLRELLGLDQREGGMILKSGLAIVPRPVSDIQECAWTPGGMVSIRWDVLRHMEFDGKVRIHGDEVELQLRLLEYGSVCCSRLLPVVHRQGQGGKQTHAATTMHLDAFRWRLAKQFPNKVSWKTALVMTLNLTLLELIVGICTLSATNLAKASGHLRFIYRLVSGKETQDLVAHQASGVHMSTLGWRPWS